MLPRRRTAHQDGARAALDRHRVTAHAARSIPAPNTGHANSPGSPPAMMRSAWSVKLATTITPPAIAAATSARVTQIRRPGRTFRPRETP
jgi:hypothetical protein